MAKQLALPNNLEAEQNPMPDWLDRLGYRLCWRVSWFSQFVWCPIWYRWRCPYPTIDDHSVRACITGGHCGCDNATTMPWRNWRLRRRRVGKITMEQYTWIVDRFCDACAEKNGWPDDFWLPRIGGRRYGRG